MRRVLAALALALLMLAGAATAQPPEGVVELLDVRVNGWPLGLVGDFQNEDGRLSLPVEEFEGLGFKLDPGFVTVVGGQRRVYLDQAGLSWKVDARAQAIDISAPFSSLAVRRLAVSPGVPRTQARSDWGALIGYDAFGQWTGGKESPYFGKSLTTNLEARLFSPWFTASTTGYDAISADEHNFVRLETAIEFDNLDKIWRLRLGDTTSTGPTWERTFRFGGFQWGTDLSLRPDIITTPMPQISRNIGVPSTIDLLINGVRRYSSKVDPGAFNLTNLPITTGVNSITVQVTDQAGRRTQVTLPLYSTPDILAAGLSNFSVQGGVARQDYSSVDSHYDGDFLAGGYAYGVTDRLTLTGRAAAAKGYGGGAFGAAATIGHFFVVDTAAQYSNGPRGSGWAWYGQISRSSGPFNVEVQYAASSPAYQDLSDLFGYTRILEQETATAGLNLGKFGDVNVVYTLQHAENSPVSRLATANYGVDLFNHGLRLSTSAYANLDSRDWGATISLSFPLGRAVQAYVEHSAQSSGEQTQLAQVRGQAFNQRLNWEAEISNGAQAGAYAEADWEGHHADLRLRATTVAGAQGYEGEIAQSFVFMGNQLFVANRVQDAFTVVDAGAPNVRVALENRTMGRTDSKGRLFVNDLQSYLPNALSIEPLDLPMDATVDKTALLATPRLGGGAVTHFNVKRERAALVILVLPSGQPPPVGAEAHLNGSSETALTGFGGETYVQGVKPGDNLLEVRWSAGTCKARFTDEAKAGDLPRVGPVTCAP
jgi:outer membrane usher protein